jgi:hypothetical protein
MTQVFNCTSAEPYTRHSYKVHFFNKKSMKFEHWEDAQDYWFANCDRENYLKYITVEDINKRK